MTKPQAKNNPSRGDIQQYPLLATKLYIPQSLPSIVPRPDLTKRLTDGMEGELTLISAPAGFGKTTLLGEWIHKTEMPVAWISLDAGDNDPVRFLTYLVAALQNIEPGIGKYALATLQSPQSPPIESVLTNLINEITALPNDFVLALDDYHLVDEEQIHNIVEFLLDHLPRKIHLVIACRADPPLSLARLRSRNKLREFRASDLSFTTEETTEFFNKGMSLGLSNGDIAMLESRTEGWIAGMQLAGLSMQSCTDAPSFIKLFAGDDRHIMDYLVEQVMDLQSEQIQNFLLHTSILNRLSEPLCDYVTGQTGSQEILNQLERANLFIVPLDNKRQWFRYHHLFADLLRQQLHQAEGDLVPELHRRASKWFEQNGLIEGAIDHAMFADEVGRAGLILSGSVEEFLLGGERIKLRAWLDALPTESLVAHSSLGICLAWLQFSSGNLDDAEKSLDLAEKASSPSNKRENGKIAVVRSWVATFRGDFVRLTQLAQHAMKNLPADEKKWRGMAALAAGYGYYITGDMPAAEYSYMQATKLNLACDNIYFSLIARGDRALALAQCGDLTRALNEFQTAHNTATKTGLANTEIAGWLLAAWGEVLAKRNDIPTALKYVNEGADLAEQGTQTAMLSWAYMAALRVILASEDQKAATDWIQRVDLMQQKEQVPPWISHLLEASKARLYIMTGSQNQITSWITEREISVNDQLSYPREGEYIVLARHLIAQGLEEDAKLLLDRLMDSAQTGGRTAVVIELLILNAQLHNELGDSTSAFNCLTKALSLASFR